MSHRAFYFTRLIAEPCSVITKIQKLAKKMQPYLEVVDNICSALQHHKESHSIKFFHLKVY